MNTKLTLNIDEHVIEEAKFYAKNNSVSLSKLIENYLLSLTKRTTEASKSVVSVNVDANRYENLKLAQKIYIKATLNTNSSEYVKLFSDYKLKLILTGEFSYHAGKR